MFSVVFPGQGSQKVGMGSELFKKFEIVKKIYKEADEILQQPITKLIFEGPDYELNLTENSQPAIFLVSYSIFQTVKKEFGYDFDKAAYFAGHSLGEYSALACTEAISFSDTLKILKKRGISMQNAVPQNKGGMLVVLGERADNIQKIIDENKENFECFIANDNSSQQLVVSGLKENLNKFSENLNSKKIKNMMLNVSAPFHCKLMNKATDEMRIHINNLTIKNLLNPIISNVTAIENKSPEDIKKLLISQIEDKVRWFDVVNYMINKGVTNFIEIGPGKVLSGLIKRINKDVKIDTINSEDDIKLLKQYD